MNNTIGIDPVTVDLGDSIVSQLITTLEGQLEQQRKYTDNAVRECMRLRGIIAKCDRCRDEANAASNDKPKGEI